MVFTWCDPPCASHPILIHNIVLELLIDILGNCVVWWIFFVSSNQQTLWWGTVFRLWVWWYQIRFPCGGTSLLGVGAHFMQHLCLARGSFQVEAWQIKFLCNEVPSCDEVPLLEFFRRLMVAMAASFVLVFGFRLTAFGCAIENWWPILCGVVL